MLPGDGGKFCNSCERTITDFRNRTKEELQEVLKVNKKVCGIFSEKQVAKGYENYHQLVATTVLAIGISMLSPEIQAQEETDPFQTTLNPTKKDTVRVEENVIVGVIIDDEYPEYPGGLQALRDFISTNLVYPSDSTEGKVWVSFVVDTTGRTQNIQIKKSVSPLGDAEVIRVVRLMQFIPAKRNGKPVHSKMNLPVTFRKAKED